MTLLSLSLLIIGLGYLTTASPIAAAISMAAATSSAAETSITAHGSETLQTAPGSPSIATPTCTTTMYIFGNFIHGPTSTSWLSTVTSYSEVDCAGCSLDSVTEFFGVGPAVVYKTTVTATTASVVRRMSVRHRALPEIKLRARRWDGLLFTKS